MPVRPFAGRRRLALLALAAVVALPAAADARRGPPRNQKGEVLPRLSAPVLGRVTRRMDADAKLRRLLALCPADVAGEVHAHASRAHAPAGAASLAACGRRAEACLSRCLEGGDRLACFDLAQIVQAARGVDPLYGETLYQLACAAGEAGGCINRAASLRNTTYAGDPYPKQPEAARQACQFKSFDLGCEAGASWGCAMRGQAYALGEGVRKDAAAARRDFTKACAADPHFAACTYAKALRDELDKAPAPPGGDGAKGTPIRY